MPLYLLQMAIFDTSIIVRRPVQETFAFVSDFRNAEKWDPRTYAVEKTTPGDIGAGTRFVLTGGALTKRFIRALRIPPRIAGSPLPYDVVSFDPPRGFVLEGETPVFWYRDRLEFSEAGDGTTRLRYHAELRFKGILMIGEPFLRLLFNRIGIDATKDLAAVVEADVPSPT